MQSTSIDREGVTGVGEVEVEDGKEPLRADQVRRENPSCNHFNMLDGWEKASNARAQDSNDTTFTLAIREERVAMLKPPHKSSARDGAHRYHLSVDALADNMSSEIAE
eukprot:400897-Pyramimonas_sp.AAC.1